MTELHLPVGLDEPGLGGRGRGLGRGMPSRCRPHRHTSNRVADRFGRRDQ